MFSGIVSDIGAIESANREIGLRIMIRTGFSESLSIGESVAVSGVCLTVVEKSDGAFSADVSAETLARTAPRWGAGQQVNLERALKLGDALSGHLVSGHVDGVATIRNISSAQGSHVLEIEVPAPLSRYIAEKGSVALDGVSLTVNKVEGARFWVTIIPHTWQNTTFGSRKTGDSLNLEVDMLARYVERLIGTKN